MEEALDLSSDSILNNNNNNNNNTDTQGCTDYGGQVTVAVKSCTAMPSVCGSSLCNLLHVIPVGPFIFRWLLDFWKICAAL